REYHRLAWQGADALLEFRARRLADRNVVRTGQMRIRELAGIARVDENGVLFLNEPLHLGRVEENAIIGEMRHAAQLVRRTQARIADGSALGDPFLETADHELGLD